MKRADGGKPSAPSPPHGIPCGYAASISPFSDFAKSSVRAAVLSLDSEIAVRDSSQTVVEIADRNFQRFGKRPEASGRYAVCTAFVFLDLLKCQAEKIAKPFLTHADQHPPDANAIADLGIYGVGLFFWHRTQHI